MFSLVDQEKKPNELKTQIIKAIKHSDRIICYQIEVIIQVH